MHVTFSLDQLMSSLNFAQKEKCSGPGPGQHAAEDHFCSRAGDAGVDRWPTAAPADGGSAGVVACTEHAVHHFVRSEFAAILSKGRGFLVYGERPSGSLNNVGSIPGNVLAEGNTLTAPPPDAVHWPTRRWFRKATAQSRSDRCLKNPRS